MLSKNNFLYISTAVLVTFLVACGGKDQAGQPADTGIKAAVTFAKGSVSVERDGKSSAAASDMVLNQADTIVTGPASAADLLIQGLGAVKLGENTKIRILNLTKSINASRAELAVDKGRMAAFVQKRQKDDSFHVVTPTAIAGVRGTVFLTDVQPASGKAATKVRISVFSGKVAMAIPGQKGEVILDKDSQIEINGMQRLSREMVRTLSPESLQQIKRLTVNHKSNSLEFNTLVGELEQANPALAARSVGGDTGKEINVRRRQMDQRRTGTDTVARANRTRDSSVLKREVDPNHIKLKPKSGYQE